MNAASTGISVQYSPEYRIQPEAGYLDRLAKETGGTYINTPEEVYKGKLKDIFGTVDLTQALLILALVLFMLDIAVRRLNLPLAAVEEKLSGLRIKLRPKGNKPAKAKPDTKAEAVKPAMAPVRPQTEAEKKPEVKTNEFKLEKPKAESLDTSLLLKKKKKRE